MTAIGMLEKFGEHLTLRDRIENLSIGMSLEIVIDT